MSDLISREKAKEILTDLSIYYDRKIHAPMISNGIDFAAQKLNDVPTVDAVPVVRCGECEYFSKAKVNKKGFLICPASGMEITKDYFCSYAEKRKGGNNEIN